MRAMPSFISLLRALSNYVHINYHNNFYVNIYVHIYCNFFPPLI